MTTENPKVAGYVPHEIFDALLKFKDEHGHKSVSQALTYILTDYLGVERKVIHQSNLLFDDKFATLQQFNELQSVVSSLPSELLGESTAIIDIKISELKSELLSSLIGYIDSNLKSANDEKESNVVSEEYLQLDLTKLETESSKPLSESQFVNDTSDNYLITQIDSKSKLQPMTGAALSKRLEIRDIGSLKKKYQGDLQGFIDFTKANDPDAIGWKFTEDKKYYPVYPE
jgi:hypothetical protein